MGLIHTLKAEHDEIKSLFNEVKMLGIENPEGQEKFAKTKSLLLAHLKKEDEQLYPALQTLVTEKKIADDFQEEMQKISESAADFFQRYENPELVDRRQFSLDLGHFLGILNARIRKEEVTLYPKYEKHCL